MTKNVLLQMKSLHYEQQSKEKPEPIELTIPATYYQKNGTHYIFYEEVMEGFTEVTKNRIQIKEDSLEITRKGTTSTRMLFEKNKKNLSTYVTPYGSMQMGVAAHKLDISDGDEQMEVQLSYDLELDGSVIAVCEMQILISEKKHID